MRYFGMVSTRHSVDYTAVALESFFETTRLEEGDRFFLIDNDGSLDFVPPSGVWLVREVRERSFAANLNWVMGKAEEVGADLFFLNNDLVFTPRWIEPLVSLEDVVVSPLSNRERQYQEDGLTCSITMDLAQYRGKERAFRVVAKKHSETNEGYQKVLFLPFFCVKIPFSVYSVVGRMDESFGRGGGEDNDYCVRTVLAGFSIAYARASYVLHFNGKSTWEAESEDETDERCHLFRKTFEEKWGTSLLHLFLDGDVSVLKDDRLRHMLERGDLLRVVSELAYGER